MLCGTTPGGKLKVSVAGRDEPLTLNHLAARLRAGCDILYLVCHGKLRGETPILVLQNEDGSWVNPDSPRWWEGNPDLVTAWSVIALNAGLN